MLNIFLVLESFQVYKLIFGQRALALPIIFIFLMLCRSTTRNKIKKSDILVYLYIIIAVIVSSGSMEDLLFGVVKVLLAILCLECLSINRTKDLNLKIPAVAALLFVIVEFLIRYSSIGFDLAQIYAGSHDLKLVTPFFSDTNGLAIYILLTYIFLLSIVTSLKYRILVFLLFSLLMLYTASVAGTLGFTACSGLYAIKHYPKFGWMLALVSFVILVISFSFFYDGLVSYGLYDKLTHTFDIFSILSNNLKLFIIGNGVFSGAFYGDTGQYLHSYWAILISSIGFIPSIVYIVIIYVKLRHACSEPFVIIPMVLLSLSYLNPFTEFIYFFLALINVSLFRQETVKRNDRVKAF